MEEKDIVKKKEISLRENVLAYVQERYESRIEYLWYRYPGYAVFRHEDNRKWYGIVMDVPKSKLGLSGDGAVDILNVKITDLFHRDWLLQRDGFLPGYHMSRSNWVTVLLDGTVGFDEISELIDRSYGATAGYAARKESRPPREWIVPANPKYYDIEHAFDSESEIIWKQGSGIRKGDTVFMYVAAPVSAILFECVVTDTDMPYRFTDGSLTINAVMKIRLTGRFGKDEFTFDRLKNDYGIFAVRGPRGVPNSLSRDLHSASGK